MKPPNSLLALTVTCAALSPCGCVPHLNAPLVNPKVATVDSNLLGSWTSVNYKDFSGKLRPMSFRIAKSSRKNLARGLMAVYDLTDKEKHVKPSYFVSSSLEKSVRPNYRYASMFVNNGDIGGHSPCDIARYMVKGNVLQLWPCDVTTAAKLVKSGAVRGKFEGEPNNNPLRKSGVTMNNSSLKLYLTHHAGDRLFSAKSEITFRRVG